MFTASHLHAMVIHFPITLIFVGFLFELIALINKKDFFKKVSFYMLLLGALGTVFAYVSGSYAGEGILEDGILKEPIELHEEAALVTLWLSIIASLFKTILYSFKYKKSWAQWISVLLIAVLVGSVARTGYLGGQLVFKHGAGIELALPDFGNLMEE